MLVFLAAARALVEWVAIPLTVSVPDLPIVYGEGGVVDVVSVDGLGSSGIGVSFL